MNRRILKKLCARAAPLLPQLGDKREQFKVEAGDAPSWTCTRMDRKDLERWPLMRAAGYFDALPGTIGVGAITGYYDPEWSDEPAYDALAELVWWHFVGLGPDLELLNERRLPNPRAVFQHASLMLADLEKKSPGG